MDIQLTDYAHFNGVHGPVLSSSNAQFTVQDYNCAWSRKPGNGSIPVSSSLGFAALEHAFIEDEGENLTLRDIMFDESGLAWARGKLNSGVVVKNDQFFVADGFMAGGGENINCDANYCGAVIYNPGGVIAGDTLAGIAYITNSVFSLQCGGNAINWLSGNVLSVVNSVIQGFQQYGIRAGNPRGNFGPMSAYSVYQEVGVCENPIWKSAGFSGQAAQSMAGINMLGGFLNLSTQLANGIVGQEPRFASGGNATYEYWLVINDGGKTSMPIRFGQAAPSSTSKYVIGWPRYVSPTHNPVTYYVLRTTGVGNALTAPVPGIAGEISLTAAGSPVSQCSRMICAITDSSTSTLNSFTPLFSPTLAPKLWNWSGSVVLGGRAILETNELPVTDMSGIITTDQNEPQVFAQRCNDGTPGVYVICLAGNSFGNNNPAVGSLILQEGIANGADQEDFTPRLQFLSGPNSSSRPTELIGVPANPGAVLADANHRPKASSNDLWIGTDTNSTTAKTGWAMSSSASIDMCIGQIPSKCATHYLERLTSEAKAFRLPIVTNSQIASTLPTGTPPFTVASSTRVDNLTTGGNVVLEDCGSTPTCSKTQLSRSFVVRGTVTLSGGGAIVDSLPFTSSDFSCVTNDRSVFTNPSEMIPATRTSAKLNGTGSDLIAYLCMGN